MTTPPIWTVAAIDHGIAIINAKLAESIRTDDPAAASEHQHWIDRLLDMRIVRAREEEKT